MTIFLAYSREVEASEASTSRGHSVATVAALLKERDYEPLWDGGLPLTADFRLELQTWVEGCDVFVFFVSPEAVASGAFTLTELGWAERAKRCIGAVMQRDTAHTALPAPLKIPHVFVAKGDFAAEVCSHVERLARRCRWAKCASPIGVAGVFSLAFALYFGAIFAYESENGNAAYGVLKLGLAVLSLVGALLVRFVWCRLPRVRLRLRGKARTSRE